MSDKTGLRKCHMCGHDKYFYKNNKCSKCHAPKTVLKAYTNKNRTERYKVIVEV